ncbi:WxL domain-containing protein [Companilactobacillus sp. DQM5]|uniref:WxL domain-containing protein n=1 Tax=Companilactobacillus sp. DQM5 TaxID=3463359 RepID=UPI0040594D75
MKKNMILSLLVLSSMGMLITNKVNAEDKTTQADVNVKADPNGTLKINDVTPTISFNDLVLDTSKQTTTTYQKTDDFRTSIIDTRGSGAGWNLTVKYVNSDGSAISSADQAWKETTKNNFMKGAQLQFNFKNAAFTHDNGSDFKPEEQPTLNGSSITVSETDIPYLTAKEGAGLGEWTATLPNSAQDVSLSAPSATTLAGSYSANLMWTLNNAPTA